MGLLDTYPTNLFYAFFNERIDDNFTGTIWTIAKNGSTGVTGDTLDVSFDANGKPDPTIIEGTTGNNNRTEEIRLHRWYRQDDANAGVEPLYLEQTDWDAMPTIVWDADKEEYVVRRANNRFCSMECPDTRDLADHSSFIIHKQYSDLTFAAELAKVYTSITDDGRYTLSFTNLNDTLNNPIVVRLQGNQSSTAEVQLPNQTGWNLLSVNAVSGGVTKFYHNGTRFGGDLSMSSVPRTGLLFGGGTRGIMDYKGILIYNGSQTDATVGDINDSIMSEFLVTPASGTVKFNDVAFSNGVVDFFSAPSPTGTSTKVDSDVPITNGVATMTTERDPLKEYFGVARGMTQDFQGILASVPAGDVISTGLDLTGISIGGANDDHYIFRATGGTGAGTEVTVKSRTGGDITVTDASAFAIGTEFTLGRFVRGVSRVFPKD